MIVSHLLLILHKKYSFISLCLKPELWQKVAKFKGAEYFRKALYLVVRDVFNMYDVQCMYYSAFGKYSGLLTFSTFCYSLILKWIKCFFPPS